MSEEISIQETAAVKEVRRLVDEYCSSQRHPSLPRFMVHGPFTHQALLNSNSPGTEARNKPGCYVIYGADGTLKYIGMSLVNIGNRIARHFSPSAQQSIFWRQGSQAHYIDLIEVVQS